VALRSPANKIQLGFYKPGHGTKEKKVLINDDEDINNMKNVYNNKKEVMLWCYGPSLSNRTTLKSAHM